MAKKGVILKVYGKVQGVGFRFYTNKKAKELNISGFVMNRADGSVYIEAEGDETELDHFILWCDNGPSWARVTKVLRQDVPVMNVEGFKVR